VLKVGPREELEGPALIFAVQPYNVGLAACETGQSPNASPSDAVIDTISHEHAEMVTDPYGTGWINSFEGGEEIADLCAASGWGATEAYGPALGQAPNSALYNQLINGHQYYTQRLWSNQTNSCEQRHPLPPVVQSLSVHTGPATGRTNVTITGLNFLGPDVTAVHFGSAPASIFTVNSGSSITVTSPEASTGTVDVTVTTAAGTSQVSKADRFSFGAPTITRVEPPEGAKAGGNAVQMHGSGFTPGQPTPTTFKFGSHPATSVSCNSSTYCTAVAPPATTVGLVDVTATSGGKTSAKESALDGYRYF
jgi:hypothetical protein